MTERVCKGCGGEIPADKRSGTRYCSQNCQKRRWEREVYRKACADCGAEIDAHWTRCRACWKVREAEQHEALLTRIEAMWNEGMPAKGIARALGRQTNVWQELSDLRKAGRIGYRYKAYEERAA